MPRDTVSFYYPDTREIITHISDSSSNYATACGEGEEDLKQAKNGKLVNCKYCIHLWNLMQEYSQKDFQSADGEGK